MGLASKMAAAGGGAPAGYPYQQGGPQNPPGPGGQPYGGYQAYPGGAQQQYPQGQGQYRPPPPQQQYGAPPPAQYGQQPPVSQDAVRQSLQATINEKRIQSMFQDTRLLDQISQAAPAKVDQLCQAWKVPREFGQDIVKLGLFDIILYIDDSGSMQFEENGERIADMRIIVQKAAYAASLFDSDGIEVRFMNSNEQGNNVRSERDVEQLIQRVQFKGLTPMGTQLKNKVLEPLVIQKARSNQLQKPILVIVITDGQPAGEPTGSVFETIKYASNELSRTPYGKGAISFQFAQVGNDLKAREFLSKLDDEPGVGELIDSTSNFEVEQDEMSRATPPVDLTPELWLLKLLLGAIDSSYDTKDEKSNRPSGGGGQYGAAPTPQYGQPGGQYGAPPPQPYGQPPQGQYGAPPQQYGQQQYGQASQGQYGAPPSQPYGAPSPGQYGAPPPSQYGAPPQQYGQQQYGQAQGQYGAPPPQHGQPPQGQYGAPPSQHGQAPQGQPGANSQQYGQQYGKPPPSY